MKSFRLTLLTALPMATLSLGACSSLLTSKEPPPAIYALHPAATAPVSRTHKAVEVAMPSVPPGFDTDKIALYWDNGRRMDFYSGAKWPAPLDRVMQDFIAQSLSRALPDAGVTTTGSGVAAPVRVVVKIVDLQPVYSGAPHGAPHLYAALRFTMVAQPTEKVLADFTVARDAMAQDDSLTAITFGLESLAQQIMVKADKSIADAFSDRQ